MGANLIDDVQRSAAMRCKSGTQHHGQVDCPWLVDNVFFQAAN